MDTTLFNRFAPVIRNLTPAELAGAPSLYSKLTIAESDNLQVCYAPFEFINSKARVVIVGITPGHTQMLNAIKEARRQLDMGAGDLQVLMAAKSVGAFSGEMRTHLVNLLDHIGINRWLGIGSSSDLFGRSASLVQTTSALRNAVFVNGKDYNGTPSMTSNAFLREQLVMQFAQDVRAVPNAVFVPLGGKPADALYYLAKLGLLEEHRILSGLPHPSGANIERIRYFLGQKPKAALSVKTNGDAIDAIRAQLVSQVQALPT